MFNFVIFVATKKSKTPIFFLLFVGSKIPD
jgi:hypothetical protein